MTDPKWFEVRGRLLADDVEDALYRLGRHFDYAYNGEVYGERIEIEVFPSNPALNRRGPEWPTK